MTNISALQLEGGLSEGLGDILTRYNDSEEVNSAIFDNLSGLTIDNDTATVLQTYTVNETGFWDNSTSWTPANTQNLRLTMLCSGSPPIRLRRRRA